MGAPEERGLSVRQIIYWHAFMDLCCACISLADRGLFISPEFSVAAFPLLELLLALALFAWVACPILVLIVVIINWTSRAWSFDQGAVAILAEAGLCIGQAIALGPSVM